MAVDGGGARVSTVSRIVSTIDTAVTRHSRPLLQLDDDEDREGSPRKDHRHVAYTKPRLDSARAPSAISIALWTHAVGLGLVLAVCWTDMIPAIGKSSSAHEFWEHLHSTLACHFGRNSQIVSTDSADSCFQTLLCGWLFLASYLVFTVCSTKFLVISESSVFTLAVMTASLPLCGVWWSLFSMVGLSADNMGELVEWSPSVSGELICSVLGLPIVLVGLVLFTKAHFWEMSYDRLVFTCLRHQSSEP
ncbi:uncharacterized protein LOC134531078 [Bacillus rossius redtenbacheri]|uniref:uncharacterized protein LOC134531078 n=1 Tax=Bacillus rossius redtenbacheri TaxID=93214 RepID=UPI002FDDEA17